MANKNIIGDVSVSFTEAQSRQSLESGESVKTLFGKLRKWLSDLKPVAFTGSYNDLSNKPTIPTTSADITAMTGYTKPSSTSAITENDTLNQAIGKLEKGLEDAGSGSSELEEHIETNVEDEGGVHGIRCYNGKLEVFNAYSEEWLDPSEVGYVVGNVSGLNIEQGDLSLKLKWTDPIDTEKAIWKGTKVVMKVGAYPENVNDGQLICDNQIRNAYSANGLLIENLTKDVTYYFMLFPYTTQGAVTINSDNRIFSVVKKALKLGLRADFVNNVFTRLGDAVGLSGGNDFDDFPMYKRRRCNLDDDGTVNAYLGDANYSVTGGNGQVMVEQPKFYYKVAPITLNASDNKQLDVAEYWISDQPLDGYKLHPAFYNTSMQEIDYFYEGAYEGYLAPTTGSFVLESFSGYTVGTNKTRSDFRTYAAKHGNGWRQETIWSHSADQLLMIIEYGKFNMQEAIGNGNVAGGYNKQTGILNSYGNGTYGTTDNMITCVQWRGKENPWGNYDKWIDGINLEGTNIWIANNYNFADITSSNHSKVGFSLNTINNTYYARFGYDPDFNWLFLPHGNLTGDSANPIGDVFYKTSTYWTMLRSYGNPNYGPEYKAGAFSYYGDRDKNSSAGARLLYVG